MCLSVPARWEKNLCSLFCVVTVERLVTDL